MPAQQARPRAILDLITSGEAFRIGDAAQLKLPTPGNCERCNYISSQPVCKACILLEGLNSGQPRLGVARTRGSKRRAPDTLAGATPLPPVSSKSPPSNVLGQDPSSSASDQCSPALESVSKLTSSKLAEHPQDGSPTVPSQIDSAISKEPHSRGQPSRPELESSNISVGAQKNGYPSLAGLSISPSADEGQEGCSSTGTTTQPEDLKDSICSCNHGVCMDELRPQNGTSASEIRRQLAPEELAAAVETSGVGAEESGVFASAASMAQTSAVRTSSAL